MKRQEMKRINMILLFIILFLLPVYSQNVYYISNSGDDSDNGRSPGTAWKTIAKVNSFQFVAGDTVKFEKGGVFRDADLVISKSNTTYTSYGTGKLPVFGDSLSSTQKIGIKISTGNVTIDGLKVLGSNYTSGTQYGINILNQKNITIKNCVITGGAASTGEDNARGIACYNSENVKINNNEVSFWSSGMEFYGVKPLDVSYNYIHDLFGTSKLHVGIRVIGGMGDGEVYDYEYKAVIHHNEITRWSQYAVDGARGANIIWEYNHFHHCLPNAINGGGIKIGAWGGQTDGSYGSIFRYNVIHDLWGPQQPDGTWQGNAIYGENCDDAKIYYNLIYNTYGAAIVRHGNGKSVPGHKWEIYNNLFMTGSSAIQIWETTTTPTYIRNNILQSGVKVPGKSYTYKYPRTSAEENQIWHGTDAFSFPTTYDIRVQPRSDAAKTYAGKNILVKDGEIKKAYSDTKLVEDFQNLYSADPMLNSDFSLKQGSCAIDFGEPVGLTKDINGKPIVGKPDANVIEYLDEGTGVNINIKLFLEGPFSGDGIMNTNLNGHLPLSQPYKGSPWNYDGTESVGTIPPDVVDWVLIELRTGTASSTLAAKRAAFIKDDGSIVDLDGLSLVNFNGITAGNYYVVIHHRNHIKIMSSAKVVASLTPSLYNFTDASGKAYGTEALVNLGDGKWGLYAGDGDLNGVVNVIDYGAVSNHLFVPGYNQGDTDLNGLINVLDYKKTNGNLFKSSQVPN